MPLPINDATIKLVWENNPDAPITSTNLSKSADFVASYMNFQYEDSNPPHKEGTILTVRDFALGDNTYKQIVIKRGTIIGLVNTIEKDGIKILSENDHYRMFDIGLEDVFITTNDMDDNPANPVGDWGVDREWFIYLCDKMDDTLLKDGQDDYGGGGQILVSGSRLYPIGEIPGQPGIMYNEKAVRKIGGFKSNSLGTIIPESVWDISQKHSVVRAKEYYVLEEHAVDTTDNNRFINRRLRLSDLDSFSAPLEIQNSVRVFKVGSTTDAMSINVDTNTVTIPNIAATSLSLNILNATSGTISSLETTTAIIPKITSNTSIEKDNAWLSVKATGSDVYTTKTSGVSIGYGGWKALNAMHITYTGDDIGHIGAGTVSASNIPSYDAITIDRANSVVKVTGSLRVGTSGLISQYASPPTLSGTSILGYDGYFYAGRVYNAVWNDLAEYFLSDELPEFGKVYRIADDQKIEATTKRGMTNVIGVASDTPGFILKSEYEGKGIPVALAGSVKVWVQKEVKFGAELVSDKDGFATPANWFEKIFKRGAIIGKAIEANMLPEKNRILMLVK